MSNVFLAMPNQGSVHPDIFRRSVAMCSQKHRVWFEPEEGSGTCFVFNKLLCKALNARPRADWFAMLHSDVLAQEHWIDTLVDEAERRELDVCSAHVSIKDSRGITSTAVWNQERDEYRALTHSEALGGEPRPEGLMLVNTGCMLIRFTEPWVEEICFTMVDTITKEASGAFMPHVWAEDWNFAEWCHRRGLKVGTCDTLPTAHRGPKWWELDQKSEPREWFRVPRAKET